MICNHCRFKPNFVTPIEETLPLFLILYGKYVAITTAVIIAVTCTAFIMKKTITSQIAKFLATCFSYSTTK